MTSKPEPVVLKPRPDSELILERRALVDQLNTVRQNAATVEDLAVILNLLNLIDQTKQ